MTDTPFTGRKFFVLIASAFAVIIAVNLTLAVQAVRTFPGLEVANSYIASQRFDADRRAQLALGWTVTATVEAGELRIAFTGADGAPVRPRQIAVTLGRATARRDDTWPDHRFDGTAYAAPVVLARGYWNLWLDAEATDGTAFRQRIGLQVKG
jgi:nitrogen fixation protein FixH